jgi:transcriptional regulator with XRE-family HTH domain
MQIGDFIKYLRKGNGLSQDELAEEVMRSQDWMSLVETNKIEPNTEDIKLMSKALHEPLLETLADGLLFQEFKKRM